MNVIYYESFEKISLIFPFKSKQNYHFIPHYLLYIHVLKRELYYHCLNVCHRIGGLVVIVLASRAVDCGFEPWSGQAKDYKIGICCFSAKHSAVRRTSKYAGWLGIRIMCPSGEWSDMSTRGLLLQ